jgi:beta-lactamase regulating signal transducer with metallopeptidase domain
VSALITHLWSSTIVLLLALLLARALPLTARTRHALLLCGLLKFAIPYEALAAPLRFLGFNKAAAGTIAVEWIGAPGPLRTLAPPRPASIWPQALIVTWIVSAIALAAAWAIARRRLVTSALDAASPASPRERAALTAARRSLDLQTGVDVTRSTICEAPAVVRIIRPVVVLPDGGCDALDDSELELLLRHECAHVARRDNLLGILESALVAVFWFHPLVWIAQRAIATAREEACDETAAASSGGVDTYVSALSKICGAVLAARLAGVSCMASTHLKERLNHIMGYEVLRKRALSHRFVLALAAILVLGVTVVSGVDASSQSNDDRYKLAFKAMPGDVQGTIEFSGRVFESATGVPLARPNAIFKRGERARVTTSSGDRDIVIDLSDAGNKVTAVMKISQGGATLQESTYTTDLEADGPRNASGRRYTGAKLSVDLKDADVKNVLDMFAKATGTDIRYPAGIQGRVTLHVKDMPWDEAFDIVLRENRLTYRFEGDSIVVVPE